MAVRKCNAEPNVGEPQSLRQNVTTGLSTDGFHAAGPAGLGMVSLNCRLLHHPLFCPPVVPRRPRGQGIEPQQLFVLTLFS